MGNKLKVVTVVGTRPELIRLSCIINALDHSNAIEHILIHTGQNYDYELNQIFFEDLNMNPPKYYLNAAGKNSTETIGNIIIGIDSLLDQIKPDAFLILGDTNSCLSAIAAKKKKIPIFHLEAGNRCFDQRVPEETNRKIVDHLSDINLTYSSIAREYLLREGLPADRIIKIGSPMCEVLSVNNSKIESSNILQNLNLESRKYFVFSSHREENINSETNFLNLISCLDLIANKYRFPIIFSTHPRTKKMLEEKKGEINLHPLVQFLKPMGFSDYNNLQQNSFCVLSDSGTISEESSILNFRALNIRDAHERPEAMEEASVVMSGLNPNRVLQCLIQVEKQNIGSIREFNMVADYSSYNVSSKVVRIILSYTEYVRQNVWKLY